MLKEVKQNQHLVAPSQRRYNRFTCSLRGPLHGASASARQDRFHVQRVSMSVLCGMS